MDQSYPRVGFDETMLHPIETLKSSKNRYDLLTNSNSLKCGIYH